MQGYKAAMRNYARFNGRAARGEFWQFAAVIGVLIAALVDLQRTDDTEPVVIWLASIAVAVHIVPAVAVTVRRQHDLDRSGWWILLIIVPLLGAFALLLGCAEPGSYGPNRYGPDPLGGAASPTAAAGLPSPTMAPASPDTLQQAGPAPKRDPRALIAEIERLAQLRAEGILTETEFNVMKARLLNPRPSA